MWISIALTLVAVVLALLCRLVPRLRHNKAKAEKTGLPVFWTREFKKSLPSAGVQLTPSSAWPSYGLFTYLNLLLLPVASRIPFLSTLNWVR